MRCMVVAMTKEHQSHLSSTRPTAMDIAAARNDELVPVPLTPETLGVPGFRLYEKARAATKWNAATDIPWEESGSLPTKDQERAWMRASQSVYAEQAGLLTAARLLRDTNDVAARMCMSTAVADEAKHAEVFARYALVRAGSVATMNEKIGELWEGLETLSDPIGRFIVHTALEGFAADQMTLLIRVYDRDLLGTIYRYVRRDEKRHVIMGMEYVGRALQGNPEAARLLEEYGTRSLRIGGVDDTFFASMAELTGQTLFRMREWFLGEHEARFAQMLGRR